MEYDIHPQRTMWAMWLISLATNIGVAYGLVRLFNDTYDWSDVLFIFVVIMAVDIAIWMRNSLAKTISFRLVGKDFIRRVNLNILTQNNMPNPRLYGLDPEDYFSEIIGDNESSRNHLTIAAYALGQMQYPAQTGRAIESIRLQSGIAQALMQYRPADDYEDDIETNEIVMQGPSLEDDLVDTKEQEDIILVQLVKFKCQYAERILNSANLDQYDKKRVDSFIDTALAHSEEIHDEFYKGSALHPIANLLAMAGQYDRADALIERIEIDFIKDKAIEFLVQQRSQSR